MAKRIVFCSDGTWNHPGETQNGMPADTNVYKLFKTLEVSATQVPRYDDGVGADGLPVDRILGGAIGDGLFGKIKDGYVFLSHMYEDGDAIYLFGFSRGAYTARSLGGMLAACGLPAKDKLTDQTVEDAFEAYRNRANRPALKAALQATYGNRDVPIAMVGVWDTVGALGIPGDVFENLDDGIYGFLDTSLSIRVKAAYHALSIDERRNEFPATVWKSLSADALAAGNTLRQIWFPGVHSDVGGGYAETGLSDIALTWMMKNAKDNGLTFDPLALAKYTGIDSKRSLDTLHDSWGVQWGFPKSRAIPLGDFVANSAEIRTRTLTTYRPENLSIDADGGLSKYEIVTVV